MKNVTHYHDVLLQNNRPIFRLRTAQNEMHDAARKGGWVTECSKYKLLRYNVLLQTLLVEKVSLTSYNVSFRFTKTDYRT
jgi:hypothetical protein